MGPSWASPSVAAMTNIPRFLPHRGGDGPPARRAGRRNRSVEAPNSSESAVHLTIGKRTGCPLGQTGGSRPCRSGGPPVALSPFLHPFAKPAAEEFITIVRGEGAAVFDDAGQALRRRAGQPLVLQRGPRPSRDRRRGRRPDAHARELQHLRHLHQRARRAGRAPTISALSPMPDARVFLTCSGSEAVDTALKLARMTFTRRGQPERHVAGRPHARLPRRELRRRCPCRGCPSTRRAGARCSDRRGPDRPRRPRRAPSALFAERGDEIAAVIAEPVHGRRRRLPRPGRVPARPAQAVRRGRRAADLRRGHHRLRPARLVVRARSTTAWCPT